MIGKQIGRYRLIEEIGRGGMGIVYKATQITLNRTVAVKMLPEDLASSAEYLARFTREAETLATLQHPNIVHIYDVEEAHGCHFIIMEYVGGPPLTRRLQLQGRLSPGDVQSLSIALAGALEAAHRRGIIHRDIKPDNILFSEDGTPKLTDFGIARMRDSNVKTQTGVMMGTPYYMSPEQVGGTPIRAASDVYSLGVVMYEMLSGRVPFRADTPVAVALKHLHERAIPLEQVAPGVPAELCAVVERAMEKDPNDRFQSAQALRRTLRSLNLPTAAEGTSCPRCGMGLEPDFCACPGCGMAIDSPRPMGPSAPPALRSDTPPPVRAARDAADAARGAAGAARGAADAGLDRLAAAGEAVVESAGAALAAVGRSAEAVWSAVGSRREGEPGEPAGASDSAPRSLDPASKPRLALPSLGGLGALGRVRELPRLPLVAWVGVALIIGGIVVATLLADSGGTRIALDPDPSSQGVQGSPQDVLVRPPSSRVVGVIDPAVEGEGEGDSGDGAGDDGTRDDGTRDEGTDDGTRETDPGDRTPRNGDEDPGEGTDPGDDPVTPGDEEHDEQGESENETAPVSPGSDEPESADDAADREAEARIAVDGIVARQRRATETNDPDLFVYDLHPNATSHDGKTNRDAARRALRDLHRRNEDVESTISNVRIELHDSTRATVRYHGVIRATPRGDEGPRTLAEGEFRWELEYQGGRWLIVKF